jgi:hypothetical protein
VTQPRDNGFVGKLRKKTQLYPRQEAPWIDDRVRLVGGRSQYSSSCRRYGADHSKFAMAVAIDDPIATDIDASLIHRAHYANHRKTLCGDEPHGVTDEPIRSVNFRQPLNFGGQIQAANAIGKTPELYRRWAPYQWVIEGDVKGCFRPHRSIC